LHNNVKYFIVFFSNILQSLLFTKQPFRGLLLEHLKNAVYIEKILSVC
jgi:hypothetical protein